MLCRITWRNREEGNVIGGIWPIWTKILAYIPNSSGFLNMWKKEGGKGGKDWAGGHTEGHEGGGWTEAEGGGKQLWSRQCRTTSVESIEVRWVFFQSWLKDELPMPQVSTANSIALLVGGGGGKGHQELASDYATIWHPEVSPVVNKFDCESVYNLNCFLLYYLSFHWATSCQTIQLKC